MPSQPQTYRHYAYFCARGLEDTAPITSKLGIQPDAFWNMGDAFERRGHPFKRHLSSWKLNSGLPDTSELDRHIEALLRRLSPHRQALLDLGTTFKLQIVCVEHTLQNFSWELEFENQRLATKLGIGFWIDAYDYSDPHEEMVELREELAVRKLIDP